MKKQKWQLLKWNHSPVPDQLSITRNRPVVQSDRACGLHLRDQRTESTAPGSQPYADVLRCKPTWAYRIRARNPLSPTFFLTPR